MQQNSEFAFHFGHRPLAFAAGLAILAFTPAANACLSGAGATGITTGPDTVSATAKNVPASVVLSALHCGPQQLFTSRETTGGGATASFTANNYGIAALTSAAAGGPPAGSASASAAPQLGVSFRVDTLPGYSGGGTADIRLQAQVSVAGAGDASGVGSAVGGSFETTVAFGRTSEQTVEFAWTANGPLLSTTTRSLDEMFSVTLDTDYGVFIQHDQFIIATNGQSAEGKFGSAVAAGTATITYQLDVLDIDPLLMLTFPMTDALGLEAPYLGAAIDVPEVPIPAGLPLFLTPLGLLLASRQRTYRQA